MTLGTTVDQGREVRLSRVSRMTRSNHVYDPVQGFLPRGSFMTLLQRPRSLLSRILVNEFPSVKLVVMLKRRIRR